MADTGKLATLGFSNLTKFLTLLGFTPEGSAPPILNGNLITRGYSEGQIGFVTTRGFSSQPLGVFMPWLTIRCNQLLGPSAPEPKQ